MRMRAGDCEVAEADNRIGLVLLQVSEHRIEGDEVGMNVTEEADAHAVPC